MSEKSEALSALDEMRGMVKACPRGEVRLDRDTLLELLDKFRMWVSDHPEIEKPKPKPHVPYRRPA